MQQGRPAQRGARVVDPDQVRGAVAALTDGARVQHAATVLGAVGQINRLSVLLALRQAGDLCVSDLAVVVGMSDSAVSHALRLLRAHGMVTAHRQGKLVRYRISGGLITRLLDVVVEGLSIDVELHGHTEGALAERSHHG